jgi:membrane protein
MLIQRLLEQIVEWLMERFGEFRALRIIKIIEKVISVVVNTFKNWINDEIPLHGAALAFYTIFSLAPLLLVVIALSGFFFGSQAATGQISAFLDQLIGPDAASFVENIVANADQPFSGVLATAIGVGTILFTSTTVIAQLKSSLNTIWNVETREGQTIRQFLISRFTALLLVFLFAIIVVGSILLDTVIAVIGVEITALFPGGVELVSLINTLVFTLATIFLFAIIFKMLPDIKIAWSDALIGATVTTILFLLGRYMISLYLGAGNLGSTYGAAGTFVIVLIWIYYNSLTVFLGAEFTHQYTITFGHGVRVPKHARIRKQVLQDRRKKRNLKTALNRLYEKDDQSSDSDSNIKII